MHLGPVVLQQVLQPVRFVQPGLQEGLVLPDEMLDAVSNPCGLHNILRTLTSGMPTPEKALLLSRPPYQMHTPSMTLAFYFNPICFSCLESVKIEKLHSVLSTNREKNASVADPAIGLAFFYRL